jgi:hypothetical protein
MGNSDKGVGKDGSDGLELRQTVENRAEGKKTKWGHVKAEGRSSRIRNDGRTSLEKAHDQKKEDQQHSCNKGKSKKPSKISHTKQLKSVPETVGVDMGSDSLMVEENIHTCIEFDSRRNSNRVGVLWRGLVRKITKR